MNDGLPDYAGLRARKDVPAGTSWGLLGELGTIAHLDAARVLDGIRCVVDGEVFNLDYAINAFDPPTAATRKNAQHHIFQKRPTHRDDYLDALYLQGTTQIDGLRHQGHTVSGFYNGTPPDELVEDGGPIGIDRFAEHGIVGRGVLLDVDRHLVATRGRGLDHGAPESFPVSLLDEVAAAQGVQVLPGDILLLHTGWCSYYFGLGDEERAALPGALKASGLQQSENAVAWLWDRGIALVAADNIAVEVVPPAPEPGYVELSEDGRLHPVLIAQLGLPLGELWKLDALAAACAQDERFEMLVVASPLNLRGGVGSPANAVAIR